MRRTKALLFIFLALVMVISAACSSNNANNVSVNNSGDKNVANDGATNDVNNTIEQTPIQEEPPIDMNGETLTIVDWHDGPNPDTLEGELTLKKWAEIEGKYNVKIVWDKQPWGENLNLLVNSALSGESPGDFVALDYYMAIPVIKDGLFQPLDDLFDFSDPKWPKNITKDAGYKGKTYGVLPTYGSKYSGLYFNKTLLEQEGLPNPHDLVAEGKWTWDAMLDIMKRVTKDTDGDGVVDQWGMTNTPTNLLRIIIHSNGTELLKVVDGKYVYNYQDPDVIEALRFYSDLYNVHRVVAPPRGISWSSDDYKDSQTLFNNGDAAFVTGEASEGGQRAMMSDEQGFVYFPKGPKATSWQGSIENFAPFYVPANAKRMKEKAKIWEEMQMWDRFEGIALDKAEQQLLSDQRDVDVMMDMLNYSQPVFTQFGALGDISYSIATQGETPETALERTKQTAQDKINEVFGQSE